MLVSSKGLCSLRQGGCSWPKRALHQHDIDPAAEFETHRREDADMRKTERLMQPDRRNRLLPADDGDHLAIAEVGRTNEERFQQRPADAASGFGRIDIDRIFE